MNKVLLFTLTIALLSACAQAPEAFKPTPFAFESIASPLTINAHEIRVLNHYQSTGASAHVEQQFPVPPAAAIGTWAAKRLRANSGSNQGILEVTIHDASAVAQALPKTEGLKGLITDDQEARYTVKLAVTFKYYPAGSNAARATGDVTVSRSRTINERATVSEREAIFHQMTDTLMNEFDREANARLRHYFAAYIQ